MSKNNTFADYDIVIVGAGPAGCSTAYFLSSSYNVLMLDWSRFPRDKPCGGILVDESVEFLKTHGIAGKYAAFPRNLGIRYIDWNNGIDVRRNRNFLNISRRSFDYHLLSLSKNKVKFMSETKLIDLEMNENGVDVILEKNNKKKIIRTKYLVGADGALSTIRKKITTNHVNYYFAVQEWIKSDMALKDFVYILDDEITDFYSWLISKGSNLIIGSAIPRGENVKEKMSLFKKKLKENMGIGGFAVKKEAAVITRPESKSDIFLGKNNILMIGEAAGFISPSTGEGISFGLRSGYNCAVALNNSFESPLKEYKRLSKSLINEVAEKIKKAEILSDREKRKDMLTKLVGK